ncbi:DMT family transporter [Thiomicrorhabdus sp. 6S3-12]|uniref:DMT family transporter n=1 Tax=Thiomicrorhabdus sp. 6S3-12 TaxID=2819681 RepID=UPI001AACCC8A|nr:DMT family transporter [Thiomicrorhabdus sp. 6S3-12]MBO1925158.1 DMT family transporter [Thiomicrorhabdus sp. 6S3-12]
MLLALAYLTVVLIWTTTPLAVVWGGATDWFFAVASRTTLAALVIVPVALWFGFHRRFALNWRNIQISLFAALPIFGGMTLMYWAGQYLPSGWIAIIFAMTPLVTGVIAHFLLPKSRLNLYKIVAILISLSGLIIIFAPNLRQELAGFQLLAIASAFASVFVHSLGTVLTKRCATHLPSLDIVAAALILSALGYFVIQPDLLLYPQSYPDLSHKEVAAIVYAALIGSVVGFLLFFYLLKNMDALKVALIPVITPVFAILLGHFLNAEPLGWDVAAGAALVLIGLLLFQKQS